MSNFPAFASSLLSSIAGFLWSESMRWVVGCIVLCFIVTVIAQILDYIRS